MQRKRLSRRTVLRGCLGGSTVALALPVLEAMMPTQAARADALMAEPIFGVFFWANGVPWHGAHGEPYDDVWTPPSTGPDYTPSELLAPLAEHQASVVSGLEPKTNIQQNPSGDDGHQRGFMAALTSDIVHPEGFNFGSLTLSANRESIDQYVAKHDDFYGDEAPRFKSLALSVSDARFRYHSHWNGISYNGPWSQNLPIGDPFQLYKLLFDVPEDLDLLARRATLIDAVAEDADALAAAVGQADKHRIEEHMEHLYEVQRRLQTAGSCEGPASAPATPALLHDKNAAMAELLTLALDCNLTRVFSYMFTSPATNHVFEGITTKDMHTACHDGDWDEIKAITLYQMENFAGLLTAMRASSGASEVTPFDRAVVLGVSEYSDGYQHDDVEMPVVIAGNGCGVLAPGVHARHPGGNLASAHLTCFRALGLPTQSYGFTGSETTELIDEVLA